MVFTAVREQTNRLTHRIAWVFERLGFSPTGLTFTALLVAAAGAYLIATGSLVWGAFVAGVGSLMDSFDGALARRTGRVTAFGGYLDSLVDRYGDGLMFLAVAWYYDTPWIWAVSFVAFLGAVATSYARARAYQDASPPSSMWSDLVERPERLLVLLVTVGFQGIADRAGAAVQFLPWVLVALAVLGHLTVLQRALRVRAFLKEAGRDA